MLGCEELAASEMNVLSLLIVMEELITVGKLDAITVFIQYIYTIIYLEKIDKI